MTPTSLDPPLPAKHRAAACAAVVLLFLLPAGVLIAMGTARGAQHSDQEEYHLPTIRQFARQWPDFDFRSYPAAMTPGYHLLMAAVAGAGGGVLAMQALTALITAGLLATLACAVSRHVRPLDTLLLCLPVAWSQYVFASGIFVVPHNLAWFGVLAILLLALRPRMGTGSVIVFGVVFLALVLVRQVHVWTLAPVLAACWCGRAGSRKTGEGEMSGSTGWKPVLRVLAAALPCALVLAWFVHLWGGLAPKTQEWVRPAGGLNLSAVAMILATAGALGVFYVGWLAAGTRGVIHWRWALAGAAVALAIACVAATSYDKDAGRWSGLWNVARCTPLIGGKSPVIIGLAGLGGFVLGVLLGAQRAREQCVLLAALLAFTAAHATINQAWQRYYEPMVLMLCVLAVGMAGRLAQTGPWLGRFMMIGLAVGQAYMTWLSLN